MGSVKPRNSGQWTESRFNSFIKSALRAASSRWGPKFQCIKNAKVGYGQYKCDMCGTVGPPTLPPPEGKKRRINNIAADHIEPVIDPAVGFVDWDTVIERMFVEVDGYQALCAACHTAKTAREREVAKLRKSSETK